MTTRKTGNIVIISSPSGGGKTSICRKLLSPTRKRQGWSFSISYTTRQQRRGERDGREYHFVSDDKFRRMERADAFAEACKVHLYRYGTPRKPLQITIRKGGTMLLDVDVQGAFKLKKAYPGAITIFILPPSIAILRRRLKRRGTETKEQLEVRYQNALKELKLFKKFEYCVVNDDLKTAVSEVLGVIASHHCRTENIEWEQFNKFDG